MLILTDKKDTSAEYLKYTVLHNSKGSISIILWYNRIVIIIRLVTVVKLMASDLFVLP